MPIYFLKLSIIFCCFRFVVVVIVDIIRLAASVLQRKRMLLALWSVIDGCQSWSIDLVKGVSAGKCLRTAAYNLRQKQVPF